MCIYKTKPAAFAENKKLAYMHDYLVSIAAPGKLPRRQDLDPLGMRHTLNAVNLIDYETDGDDFRLRYRLVGSLQCYFFANGKDPKGHYLDEFWGGDETSWQVLKAEYREALETRSPLLSQMRKPRLHSQDMVFQRALFPLASDGENVDCFLGLHDYQHHVEREGVHGSTLSPSSFDTTTAGLMQMEPMGARVTYDTAKVMNG